MAALLSVVYACGVVYFFLGWAGLQSLPPAWSEAREALPLFGLVGMLGAVSSALLLRWKRWGLYGLLGTWAATAALNVAAPRPVSVAPLVAALLLVVMTVLDIRRVWRFPT